jgi:hypothetical protein
MEESHLRFSDVSNATCRCTAFAKLVRREGKMPLCGETLRSENNGAEQK